MLQILKPATAVLVTATFWLTTGIALSAESTEANDLERLLKSRLQVLGEIASLQRQGYEHGQTEFEVVLSAERDLLAATLEVAKTGQDRIAIYRDRIETAQKLEALTQRLWRNGAVSRIDHLKATAFRLRAEADLVRACETHTKRKTQTTSHLGE